MTDLIAAILQGIVEGLTEFLPVSSTAHIEITQELLHLPRESSYWKMFAVVIQLGAILAVIAYFRVRLTEFVKSFFGSISKTKNTDEKSLPWYRHPLMLVGISFVVTAIPCFLMDELIGEHLENLWVIGSALLVGGIAMYVIDRMSVGRERTHKLEDMTLVQAIAIGAAQILSATFPGTSRSMSTIAGGQLMGLSRSTALEFSFFLSIPVMFAASGLKLVQYIVREKSPMSSDQLIALGAGFITSFIVALAVIAWFMSWVRTKGFTPFAVYRVVAGIAVLAWVWSKG